MAASAAIFNQLRQGIGEAAGADIVNKGNRVVVALLPALIDHFLTAPFDFWVHALH